MPAIRQIPSQRGPCASGYRRTVVNVKNAVRDVWLQTRKLSGKHYGKSEGGQVHAGRVQLLADFSPVSYLFQQVELAGTTSFVSGSSCHAIIGCCLPRGICTGVCLARCSGGWMHCRCRAGSTTIAVAKSGAEGGGSEQCLRTRLRGSKRGSSEGQKRTVGDSADPARSLTCASGGS